MLTATVSMRSYLVTPRFRSCFTAKMGFDQSRIRIACSLPMPLILRSIVFLLLIWPTLPIFAGAPVDGWLEWRGPRQNGTSAELGLPDSWTPGGKGELWTYPIAGGGTPVIAGSRVYVVAYTGEGPDLQEVLLCLRADTGKLLWQREFNDFLSDIIYNRYAIGAPAVDGETGNVYITTSPGLVAALDSDGNALWERSMMEEFGRLTFPNGRTGCPTIDGNLVIVHGITANWGKNGPARNRFYAFDKHDGSLAWYSEPGVRPMDSSFSTPVFGNVGERRVLYSGTGCGNLVCVDARTGQPLWRFQFSHGGVNSSVLLYGQDKLIAIHGKENLDDSTIGRMVALRIPTEIPSDAELPMILGADVEIWRNELESFTSSPVLHQNRIYQTVRTGKLVAVDADSGKIAWSKKLSPDQLHASPLWADGKLYVPMVDGAFYIVRPGEADAEILSRSHVEGNCIGSPSTYGGQLYLHSKEKLYCIGEAGDRPTPAPAESRETTAPRAPSHLQLIPAEFAVRPRESLQIKARILDAKGNPLDEGEKLHWSLAGAPGVAISDQGVVIVGNNAGIGTGSVTAEAPGLELKTSARFRVLPALSYRNDFDATSLDAKSPGGEPFAYPPSPWLGARMRWQVLSTDNPENQILGNTLDRVLFQRSMNFVGHPDMSGYTVEADVMSDGNRRVMSNVGVINQRYLIALIGNWQILEVVSNHDRVKVSVPYRWRPSIWYRLKTRVDVRSDGSGVVRAKVWERDSEEPAAWTIEVPHRQAHTHGAPGIYAFSPQSQKKVFIDNLSIWPSEPFSGN